MGLGYLKKTVAFFCFLIVSVFASSVAVHDPSVVLVYKDNAGNSYPEQDAQNTRTKYYYIFGTMRGGAYSKDLINWTSFTPTFSLNGKVSTDYYSIFKAEGDYAEHTTTEDLAGNMWAPDIIYNKKKKKWCLYFSIAGVDWKSSVVLLTADRIEGPYTKTGVVVYGGMDNATAGSFANKDYEKVTGSATIDSRYYFNWVTGKPGSGYDGGYGVSAIDPNVFYDENGTLWLLYGSWSGGLFMLKLDESTGLRDYSYTYGTAPEWEGVAFKSALKKDPYMGIHVGGGYYVSGEGAYIEYMKDAKGKGYYYLFVSYGFYSPEGGYSMRVFRSENVTGPYTDVDGTPALFSGYTLNYWQNTENGFPIIQNYRWSFWGDMQGEIATGHNSVLTDDDGRYYLVYHRKFNNGTAWHNVETHELVFGENGWINALPFEHRIGYGLSKKEIPLEHIVGHYKMILHNPIGTDKSDSVSKLGVNTEQDIYLNADGTVTGALTGTWEYKFANGSNYFSVAGFSGALAVQLMNDVSKQTITFTGMNAKGDRALWGYRMPTTRVVKQTTYQGDSLIRIGKSDFTTAWNAYDDFYRTEVPEAFDVEFKFKNYRKENAENWNNFVLVFKNGEETWYLRSDNYSVETFSGSAIGYKNIWGEDYNVFKEKFDNADVTLKASRSGTTINVFTYVGDSLVYQVSAKNTPAGNYSVYLGADASYLDLKYVSSGKITDRAFVGAINDAGRYTTAFNSLYTPDYPLPAGDFTMNFRFKNYGNGDVDASGQAPDNWDNFIIREISDAGTMLLRADVYALDEIGQVKFVTNVDDYAKILRNADVDLTIMRAKDTISLKGTITAENGDIYSYKAIQMNAPTDSIAFGFTAEASAVDLMEVSYQYVKGKISETPPTTRIPFQKNFTHNINVNSVGSSLVIQANQAGIMPVYNLNGSLVRKLRYNAGESVHSGFSPGIYLVGCKRILLK